MRAFASGIDTRSDVSTEVFYLGVYERWGAATSAWLAMPIRSWPSITGLPSPQIGFGCQAKRVTQRHAQRGEIDYDASPSACAFFCSNRPGLAGHRRWAVAAGVRLACIAYGAAVP